MHRNLKWFDSRRPVASFHLPSFVIFVLHVLRLSIYGCIVRWRCSGDKLTVVVAGVTLQSLLCRDHLLMQAIEDTTKELFSVFLTTLGEGRGVRGEG